MTRETKIGLLVGLGVILLVGIILTDHLAIQSPRQDVSALLQTAQRTGSSLIPPAIGQDAIFEKQTSDPLDEIPRTPQNDQAQPYWADHDVPKRALAIGKPSADALKQVRQIVKTEKRLSPTVQRKVYYSVKRNDSLTKIARHHYGNGKYWRLIQKANPKSVRPDGQVRVGVRLVIPSLPGKAKVIAPPIKKMPLTYTVQAGDSLWRIAQKQWGNGKRYREILEANRSTMRHQNDLVVGQRLILP